MFLGALQDLLFEKAGKLKIRTQHKRHGMIFRGNPFYRKTHWRDYVLVDYGPDGKLPSEIWCFVDLSEIKPGTVNIENGGTKLHGPGVFAVVEVGYYSHQEEDIAKSEIFLPFSKETRPGSDEEGGGGRKRQFYLVDVEAFVEPMVVVPDVGGKRNAYFHMKGRDKWVRQFEDWVRDPHNKL